MKKIFLLSLLYLLLSPPIFAADININCNGTGSCNKSNSNPLFSQNDIWSPGMTISKTISIKNNSAINQNIGIRANNYSNTGNFDTVLNLSIIQNNNILWSGTLNKFYNSGEINLTNLNPNVTTDFIFKIAMNKDAGNIYQNKKIIFDLNVGFVASISSTPAGEIKGTATTNLQPKLSCEKCIWWWVLLAENIVLIIYFIFRLMKKRFDI